MAGNGAEFERAKNIWKTTLEQNERHVQRMARKKQLIVENYTTLKPGKNTEAFCMARRTKVASFSVENKKSKILKATL